MIKVGYNLPKTKRKDSKSEYLLAIWLDFTNNQVKKYNSQSISDIYNKQTHVIVNYVSYIGRFRTFRSFNSINYLE